MLSLTISDVTALKRREASFRLLFDNNPMPMWVFDVETTRFLSVNDAAIQHYGFSRGKFLSMKLQDIWPRDEWSTHHEALQQIDGSHYSGRNWRHLKADGSEIQVLTYGRRVAFDGRDAFMVAVVDVTERGKAEARIAIEREITSYADRAEDARREMQRAVEMAEKAKSELRSLLMTHMSLIERPSNAVTENGATTDAHPVLTTEPA